MAETKTKAPARVPAKPKAPTPKERGPLDVDLYSADGRVKGDLKLPESLFGITPHTAVMHQALVRQLANGRQGTADTKTRGEVSGGGRKPYRQKGTGRSRHGSIREPSMPGGGVVFGPHPRPFSRRMPRKMRRLALRSGLSAKARERQIRVLEGFGLEEPRTAAVAELLEKVGVGRTALIVLPAPNLVVSRSVDNLPWAKVILAGNLNLHDLFTHDTLVLQQDSLQLLEEMFSS